MAVRLKPGISIRKNVLDDIASRFLINLPGEERDDIMKVCDHLETAYWFYLDFLRPDDPSLPACNFEEFLATVFHHCSYVVPDGLTIDLLTAQWKSRKYRKPVRGAILLNNDCNKCLLVQGYPASSSWGFPKGKMNEGEKDTDAAVREVYEEVGLDIRTLIREDDYIEIQQRNGQSARMFIIPGIDDCTEYTPRCRNEIKDIQWFKINDLPSHRRDTVTRNHLKMNANKFFLILPFLSKLKKRIHQIKQSKSSAAVSGGLIENSGTVTTTSSEPDIHRSTTVGDSPPSKSPYFDYYYNLITPSRSWNSFEFDSHTIIRKFREK